MSVSVPLAPPFKVKARYGWSGQTKGDLGFLEGDVMEVTRITGDWFYGRLLRNKKCSGYFPNNFVNILEEQLNKSSRSATTEVARPAAKISVPPIPARSRGRASESSAPKEKPSSKLYEHSSRSTSDLAQDTINTRKTFHYRSRPSHEVADRYGRLGNSQDDLPPLPPIPNMQCDKTSRRLPKSYSSSDVPSSSDSRSYNHYRGNQAFYDGYKPEKSSLNGNSNASGIFSDSRYLATSSASSEESFALMSDFSATSAGSFARHRYAQSFTDSLERSQSPSSNEFIQAESNSKMSGILKRITPKSNPATGKSITTQSVQYPRLPDIQNLSISASHDEARDWLAVKTHLNRSRSLTKYEKHPRYMRALERNRDLVLHPQDAIYNGLNTNEVTSHGQPGLIDIELSAMNFDYIDKMTRNRCVKDGSLRLDNWAQTTFSARYSTTIEKLRGIYVFCAETFELIDDHGSTDFSHFSKTPKIYDSILHRKHCTPYQLTCLYKALTNALGITCELVFGFLKTPTANDYDFKYNHCWLRVLVNKEWRFIDVILGNTSNPIHEFVKNRKITKADDDYFLVEPLRFIYTHIPQKDFEQHIVPSIDRLSALYLPLVFPSFFTNGLKLYKYSTALAFLEDSEIFECSLEIPSDIELFASVVIPSTGTKVSHEYRKMELALVQVKRHKTDNSQRIAVVKAVLPPGANEGTLYIHSGVRGIQTTVANVHPLSMMVPLKHVGSEMKYEFAVRKPSESVQKVEMYIIGPQNKFLFANNEYDFEVIQHPFDSVIYSPTALAKNRRQPMAIKSPSGKIYELRKNDPHFAYGTWKTAVHVRETGTWTGLVTADSGVGWCAFAEWLCV
ncbi:hypothetical protein HG536_0A02470 [Torulaspora globosa]|uniref:SH3 domain-containing protein n=1 Tax=Torulaspora globosa TaxID=48254 RepID=A0A7G3ZA94_9SACH|nr:uncharacterized protein HG536_0A02470 [Torulaspora globosa]QLL30430.1 hypothetical protein HG536_0A02470 [Torulaspora globosa]